MKWDWLYKLNSLDQDSALSRFIRDGVRKECEEAWQALRIEFEATKTDLLDSVRVATAGTPAEVVGLVVPALEGVGTLERQLFSVKAEVIKQMNGPSGLEEVEKLMAEFEEVKLEVARLFDHPAYTEGGMAAWRTSGKASK